MEEKKGPPSIPHNFVWTTKEVVCFAEFCYHKRKILFFFFLRGMSVGDGTPKSMQPAETFNDIPYFCFSEDISSAQLV